MNSIKFYVGKPTDGFVRFSSTKIFLQDTALGWIVDPTTSWEDPGDIGCFGTSVKPWAISWQQYEEIEAPWTGIESFVNNPKMLQYRILRSTPVANVSNLRRVTDQRAVMPLRGL